MTPQQIALIAQTWYQIEPSADRFTGLFYQRLGQLNPDSRRLFPEGDEQCRRMVSMLDTMVATLDLMDNLVPALKAMGQRYAGEGTTARDYQLAEEAMLWTLERALGEAFTPPVREAWSAAFHQLTAVMLENLDTESPGPGATPRTKPAVERQSVAGPAGAQSFAGESGAASSRGSAR